MAVGTKPDIEPQKRGGAKGQVIRAVQLNLGRPSTRQDIIWEVLRTDDSKYKCVASVPHLGLVATGAVCDDRKLAEKAAAEAMVPLITGLPTGKTLSLLGSAEKSSLVQEELKSKDAVSHAPENALSVENADASSDNGTDQCCRLDAAKVASDMSAVCEGAPCRYEHLWHEDPAAETCLSEEVCALINGDIVYAWRCCLGIGRIREVRCADTWGLDLNGLYEELCVWGFGLRSTMLFDDSIPFQITANIVQCRSEPVRRILEDIFQRLKRFHTSLGQLQHLASPFEVIERWAASKELDLPIVMLGGHRPVKEFVERHPELPCKTVSACRKRADSSYGKSLPFDAFVVVNTIYRTKAIQKTRLEYFMKQHEGRVKAVLNYDPNIEVLPGEASYFKCFTEKRELALLLHGMLASWSESRAKASLWGLARALLTAIPLAFERMGKSRSSLITRISAFAVVAELMNAAACLCTWRVGRHQEWLCRYGFYSWVRKFPTVATAPLSWLACNVFMFFSTRGSKAWRISEACRSGTLLLRVVGIMLCYPQLIRGFQLHYERELRSHGTVTVQTREEC